MLLLRGGMGRGGFEAGMLRCCGISVFGFTFFLCCDTWSFVVLYPLYFLQLLFFIQVESPSPAGLQSSNSAQNGHT